jgi:hypothetical protein
MIIDKCDEDNVFKGFLREWFGEFVDAVKWEQKEITISSPATK